MKAFLTAIQEYSLIKPHREEPTKMPQDKVKVVSSSQLKCLLAGGVAGAVSRTSVSPLERLKILYQLQVEDVSQRKLRGIIPTLRKIWLEEGLRGYFKVFDTFMFWMIMKSYFMLRRPLVSMATILGTQYHVLFICTCICMHA
jgi:hypothetical protein